MPSKLKTIDEYLALLSDEKRATLEKLRALIHAAAPGAEECISYNIPTIRLDGRGLVAFGAAKHHCALYPMSSTTVVNFKDELAGYETSKGAVRFPDGKPLPAALVRKLVKARVHENNERVKPRKKMATSRRAGRD